MGESAKYRPLVRLRSCAPTPPRAATSDVRIEGNLDGIFDGRSVTVVEGASITGEVGGEIIDVYGAVHGRIRGRAVRVRPTGRVDGEVEYVTLKVDPGATLNARCVPC